MWIDLPSGATANLEAPEVLRSKHTRAITRALTNMGKQRVGDFLSDVTDGALAVVVLEWTCTGSDGEVLPIPSASMESLDDLDPRDYDILLNHDATSGVAGEYLKLRLERVSPDDHADPDSPTAPSDASGPALREEPSLRTKTGGPRGTKSRSTSRSLTAGGGPPTK